MIIGTGIDIVKNQRIERLINKYGKRFLNKIYLASEIKYCSKQANFAASYAARFAAKESVLKALGTGMRNNSWQDIEIINTKLGKPEVKLYNKTAEQASKLNVKTIFLSISHEKDFSIAQIILEGA